MTTAPHATEYPVIGVSRLGPEKRYVFVTKSYIGLRALPLHDYIRGMTRDLIFVCSTGKVYKVNNIKLDGIYWTRVSEIGYITSLITTIFSLFNVPVLTSFDLVEDGYISLDDLKKEIRAAFRDFPRAYFRFKEERVVRRRLDRAKSFEAIADAIY